MKLHDGRMPLKHKLPLVNLLTSTVLLIFVAAFLLLYEYSHFRDALEQEVASLAGIVGANCAAAAEFEDSWSATEVLRGLSGGDHVRKAVLYSRTGAEIGRYTRSGHESWQPPEPRETVTGFSGGAYLSITDVTVAGKKIGTLYLEADAGAITTRIRNYALLIGYVFFVALGLTLLISYWMQSVLLKPVLRLAETARHVSARQDYGFRMSGDSTDEVGDLVTAFNEMLGEIEKRDHSLEMAREDLQIHIDSLNEEIEQRKKAQDELVIKETQLRQAQKMEAVGILAGGVAHDFNNILTAILGYSQLMLHRMDSDSPIRDSTLEIKRAAERAAGLTRQLLSFSRKQVLQPQVVQVNTLISDMQKMLGRLIGEDIECKVLLEAEIAPVLVDPGELEQIILNLVVNSKDAMPNGGTLIIETRQVEIQPPGLESQPDLAPGSYIRLTLSDTGVGIPPDVQSRIFDPFFTTKGLGRGTGLGLSTVYGIVKQSGGQVSVSSKVNEGTTFQVHFPISNGVVSGAWNRPLDEISGGIETILVVEDEAPVRQIVLTILRSAGYNVLEALDPADALVIGRRHEGPIDLLLTDVVMPRMNGRQLSEQILVQRPGIAVLFMSGYTDDAAILRNILEDRLPFIGKPFSSEALLDRVREVLEPESTRLGVA